MIAIENFAPLATGHNGNQNQSCLAAGTRFPALGFGLPETDLDSISDWFTVIFAFL